MYGWRVNFEVQSLDIEARKGVIEADILWPVPVPTSVISVCKYSMYVYDYSNKYDNDMYV